MTNRPCRIEWDKWTCASCKVCDHCPSPVFHSCFIQVLIEAAAHTIYSASTINQSLRPKKASYSVDETVKYYHHNSDTGSQVTTFVLPAGWVVPNASSCFILTDFSGSVFLIKPKSPTYYDWLFLEYQEQALDRPMFRRAPLKSAFGKSDPLNLGITHAPLVPGQHTNHFLHK